MIPHLLHFNIFKKRGGGILVNKWHWYTTFYIGCYRTDVESDGLIQFAWIHLLQVKPHSFCHLFSQTLEAPPPIFCRPSLIIFHFFSISFYLPLISFSLPLKHIYHYRPCITSTSRPLHSSLPPRVSVWWVLFSSIDFFSIYFSLTMPSPNAHWNGLKWGFYLTSLCDSLFTHLNILLR